MSKERNEIVDNIIQPPAWIRALFVAVFVMASYFVLLPLVLVLSIAQALFTIITGSANANLKYFSAALELYVSQLFKFMTYLSDVKPFPFSGFPEVKDDSLLKESAVKKGTKEKASATSAAVKKPAAKKKSVKKKAAKKSPRTTEKPEVDAGDKGASDS